MAILAEPADPLNGATLMITAGMPAAFACCLLAMVMRNDLGPGDGVACAQTGIPGACEISPVGAATLVAGSVAVDVVTGSEIVVVVAAGHVTGCGTSRAAAGFATFVFVALTGMTC
ncbi:MAG TPA: hypothetical protein VFX16_07740 [Pseudonocardiaceae bacterium]|nr:hypothetical protein [Pseudonocardiaceae bacterium]